MKKHEFSAGTVERVGNVLKITYSSKSVITLDDMKEVTAIREQLFGKECYASLIDLRQDFKSISPEAKRYVTENKTIRQLRVAEVLLVKNFAQQFGVHTYIRIFRSGENITVMTNEDNAMHWLNAQFAKHGKKNVQE